jgi:hypothetical protein
MLFLWNRRSKLIKWEEKKETEQKEVITNTRERKKKPHDEKD